MTPSRVLADFAHDQAHGVVDELATQAQVVSLPHLLAASFVSGFHLACTMADRHPSMAARFDRDLASSHDFTQAETAEMQGDADALAAAVLAGLN